MEGDPNLLLGESEELFDWTVCDLDPNIGYLDGEFWLGELLLLLYSLYCDSSVFASSSPGDEDCKFTRASSWWLLSGVDEIEDENVNGGFRLACLTLCGDNYIEYIYWVIIILILELCVIL